jgi:hypothetical protein
MVYLLDFQNENKGEYFLLHILLWVLAKPIYPLTSIADRYKT